MTNHSLTLLRGLCGLLLLAGVACTNPQPSQKTAVQVSSPDGDLEVEFYLNETGQPVYQVAFQGEPVIDSSTLGFALQDAPALRDNFKVLNSRSRSYDKTWEMPWGEQRQVRNHYRQLRIELQETTERQRRLDLVFRVYDDGLGFRYEFPEQPDRKSVV
jgi:glucan 1,4-alpha-glucosidase